MRFSFALGALLVLIAGPGVSALAQESSGRYQMEKMGDRFVRLDTQTGEMSVCSKENGSFSCSEVSVSPPADSREVDRLREENDRLRDRLARADRGDQSGSSDDPAAGNDSFDGFPSPDDPDSKKPTFKLPSEKDVDQAIEYLEGMIRKFREKFDDFGDKIRPRKEDREGTPL